MTPANDLGGQDLGSQDLGGTVRERVAEATLARLKPLLPDYGITRLANVTGLDTVGIPVWTVVRPLARSLSVSQGKGVTQELAIVSGIMESIEVFHAEQRRPAPVTRDLFECKRDASFVSPHRLTIRAGADLTETKPTKWIRGVDLLDHGERWVPAELFDLDFATRGPPPVFLGSSNGLASGNTRVEAIVHGLCEVIERDQTSFWAIEQELPGPQPNRRVIIESINDPICRPLIDKCLAAGLDVFVWSIAINVDVPVFVCTIADRQNKTPYPQQATGHGCHPLATVALARAITEAAQSRVTHISGLREDLTWSRYREEFLSETGKTKAALEKISGQPATLDFGTLNAASTDIALDMPSLLQQILRSLQAAGLSSAIAVDLADNDVFSVVFVCVPDLEYRSSKASILYTFGARMRAYKSQHGLPARNS